MVAATIRALVEAPTLPEPGDIAALIPPTREAYVRRVPGLALWLWYTATADVLTLHALTDAPPASGT